MAHFVRSIRKSVAMMPGSQILQEEHVVDGSAAVLREAFVDLYDSIISEARKCLGKGADPGAFPEEWDAQLLVDCGPSESGAHIVLFCPEFLTPYLEPSHDLDLAFRYMLLRMHEVAMQYGYVFIHCSTCNELANPEIAERMRIAFDILPKAYSKNLKNLYVLHANAGLKMTIMTFWAWMSQRLWKKVAFVDSVDEFCKKLHPSSAEKRTELRRRFPLIVQRRDAKWRNAPIPVALGMPMRQLCNTCGVGHLDRTTGRWYPLLPPILVCLCEAMEREAAHEHFRDMFNVDSETMHHLLQIIDEGRALPRELLGHVMWCALKLFLDCLPAPLLTYNAWEEMKSRGLTQSDMKAGQAFLVDIFQQKVPEEEVYVALYLVSAFKTACDMAAADLESNNHTMEAILTPKLAAEVFAPCFLRPKVMDAASSALIPVANALIETLIANADDPALWTRGHQKQPEFEHVQIEKDDQLSASDEK